MDVTYSMSFQHVTYADIYCTLFMRLLYIHVVTVLYFATSGMSIIHYNVGRIIMSSVMALYEVLKHVCDISMLCDIAWCNSVQ